MRRSREEIDRTILDGAAEVFAQHGYAHTSVQLIADTVGYSKAGLLHRFRSKESLYRAGLDAGEVLVNQVLDQAAALPYDEHRPRRVLELLTRAAIAHPGMAAMLLRAFDPDSDTPADTEIRIIGYRLLAVLNPPFSTAAERLRVALALNLVVEAATVQSKRLDFDVSVPADQLVPLVVDLALHTLYAPAGAGS